MAKQDGGEEGNEKKPEKPVEETTGFKPGELLKAPLEAPKSSPKKPPRGNLGLALAAGAGFFIFALLVGAVASWLAAGVLIIVDAILIPVVAKLAEKADH